MPDGTRVFDDITVFIEIHVPVRVYWCRFSIVNEFGFAIDPEQHEATAADVARLRRRDR